MRQLLQEQSMLLNFLVKENYAADLILVNSNPLDDVGVLSNNDNILKVIQDGFVVK